MAEAGDVHVGPVATEVAKIAVSNRNKRNGDQDTGRGRDYPPQANAQCERLGGSVAACVDKIDAYGVGAATAVGSIAVEVWLVGKGGEEIGIAVGLAFAVFQRVGVGGEEF